jgi:hypothetical protein
MPAKKAQSKERHIGAWQGSQNGYASKPERPQVRRCSHGNGHDAEQMNRERATLEFEGGLHIADALLEIPDAR